MPIVKVFLIRFYSISVHNLLFYLQIVMKFYNQVHMEYVTHRKFYISAELECLSFIKFYTYNVI